MGDPSSFNGNSGFLASEFNLSHTGKGGNTDQAVGCGVFSTLTQCVGVNIKTGVEH